MNQNEVDALCNSIYSETNYKYQTWKQKIREDVKYTIMYGPPAVEAPLLIVGENPGGRGGNEPVSFDQEYAFSEANPKYQWFATIKEIFPANVLEKTIGVNINFLHSKGSTEWKYIVPDITLRREIEAFCRKRTIALVKALRPRAVVTSGVVAYRALADGRTPLKSGRNDRPLIWQGTLGVAPATTVYGVVHLTGSYHRPKGEEVTEMRRFFSSLSWNLSPPVQSK